MSPELQIDSLMYSVFKKAERPAKVAFEFQITSFRITTAHHIMKFEEALATKDYRPQQKGKEVEDNEIFSFIDVLVNDVHVFGKRCPSSPTSNPGLSFKGDINGLILNFHTAVVYLSQEKTKIKPEP